MEWALDIIKQSHQKEVDVRNNIIRSQNITLTKAQSRLDSLIEMRLDGLITNNEYENRKTSIQNEIAELRTKQKENEHRVDNWVVLTERAFVFASRAKDIFLGGDLHTKKDILGIGTK